jgi:hypothetical protein
MLGISLIVKQTTDIVVNKMRKFYSDKDLKKTLKINFKEIPEIYNDFSIDTLIIDIGDINEYLHEKSGFDEKQSKYISYLTLDVNRLSIGSLLHEIKHIYVDWCIYKNGGNPIKETKEVKELYTMGFQDLLTKDKDRIPNLNTILRNFYYSTKLEIPSFLENHFDDINFYYKPGIKKMLEFKINDFDNEECRKEFDIIQSYDIPRFNRFKTYDKFLKYCEKFFKIRGEYIMKKINKVEYLNMVKSNEWVVYLLREHIHNKKILTLLEWDFIIDSLNAKITKRGQWDFPGECTLIPTESCRITMKNVKYDLLGIDGNGEYILMKPEKEYKFTHNYVFEIPDTGVYSELLKKIVKKS